MQEELRKEDVLSIIRHIVAGKALKQFGNLDSFEIKDLKILVHGDVFIREETFGFVFHLTEDDFI